MEERRHEVDDDNDDNKEADEENNGGGGGSSRGRKQARYSRCFTAYFIVIFLTTYSCRLLILCPESITTIWRIDVPSMKHSSFLLVP